MTEQLMGQHQRRPGVSLTTVPLCICGWPWPCPAASPTPATEAVKVGTFPTVPPEPPPQKPSRTQMEIHVEGLPTIIFLGWRSHHEEVMVAATHGKMKYRAVVDALASCPERYGNIPAIGRAIIRPGDKFDRETGKRIALARLVEQLVPIPKTMATAEIGKRKHARAEVFREIWKRTHKGALPAKPGRTYDITNYLDHLRLHDWWRVTSLPLTATLTKS